MATAVPTYEERDVSIGRVFQRATSTVAHNPLVVIGIAVVLGAVPSVVLNYATHSVMGINPGAPPTDLSGMWGAMLVSWLVAVLIGANAHGALTRATVAGNEGPRARFGAGVAAAGR